MDVKDKKLLSELCRGADLTFSNAEQLYSDAMLLLESELRTRSLFLHQISMEECAKVDIIGEWATYLMLGEPSTSGR